jgi:hypothetical protein
MLTEAGSFVATTWVPTMCVVVSAVYLLGTAFRLVGRLSRTALDP